MKKQIGFLVCLILIHLFALTSKAAECQLDLVNDGAKDVYMAVYLVADETSGDFCPKFEQCKADIRSIKTSAQGIKAANEIYDYIQERGIMPLQEKKFGGKSIIHFELDPGVYLVCQKKGSSVYDPFLVTLPLSNGDRHVTAAPKKQEPEETTPGETTPHETTPHETTPHETTPHETTPHETTPHETTPGETTPHETTPYETTPGETTPHETTPGETTPHETTPGETTPGETTPGGSTPGGSTPGGSTPGGYSPGVTVKEAVDKITESAGNLFKLPYLMSLPMTGDFSRTEFYGWTSLISGILLVFMCWLRKKKR